MIRPESCQMVDLSKRVLMNHVIANPASGIWAGGQKKVKKLQKKYGDNWISQYDLFHYKNVIGKTILPDHIEYK